MADADIARATIVKAQGGFSVAIDLRRGEQIDSWRIDFIESFEEAVNTVRAFARQYNLPWEQVEVGSR